MHRLLPTPRLMDELFNDFLTPARAAPAGWRPTVDVRETEAGYVIEAELPGLDPADVEVTVEGDTLTLTGEKKAEERLEGETRFVVERRYGSFTRTFRFAAPLAPDAVTATAKNGLLTITVTKAPETQPRRIAVQPQG